MANVYYTLNHNYLYNKILKSDWLSAVLIAALMGQCNWTVYTIARMRLNAIFFHCLQNFLCFDLKSLKYHKFCYSYD